MATEMATEMATIRWIGGAVDRAVYSTDSASSELVPTVAEKAAHIFVSFNSNRGQQRLACCPMRIHSNRQTKQVPTPM